MSHSALETSGNDSVLVRYLKTPFWESDEAENALLSPDCTLEYPFSPPGMPKTFPKEKRTVLTSWLRRTSKQWSRENVVTYPTKDPGRVWVESTIKATVSWGGTTPRQFICDQIELVIVENDKIKTIRNWSDPLAYYLAAGINLPVFHYDGKPLQGTPMPNVPAKYNPQTDEEAKAVRDILFNYFLAPDFFDEERDTPAKADLFHKDFRLRMPFMPVGMAREFDESWKASTGEWVKRTLVAWEQNKTYIRDEFVDPDVVIVESNGSRGMVKWDPRGNASGYWNDYVIFISLRDFRIKEFREYLDPINKLIAAGANIPVFPFFY